MKDRIQLIFRILSMKKTWDTYNQEKVDGKIVKRFPKVKQKV